MRKPRTRLRALLAAPVIVISILACDPDAVPRGSVRIQGAFANLASAGEIAEARALEFPISRSLIGQSSTIGVVLSDVDPDQEGSTSTTTIDEDGSFTVDVDTDAADEESEGDYIMIAYDPSLGVGVEQLLGFIELPAGADESSAGWPLGETTLGTTLDLGTMDGDSGDGAVFLAGGDVDSLYDLLGADQSELLFQAERDNYLRAAANGFLNQEVAVPFSHVNHEFKSPISLSSRTNEWVRPSEYFPGVGKEYSVWFVEDPDDPAQEDLVEQIEAGEVIVIITPPSEVELGSGEDGPIYGPEAPIVVSGDFSDVIVFNPNNFFFFVEAPAVAGGWRVEVEGAVDGVYDFALQSALDSEGNMIYFLPGVYLSVDEQSAQIEYVDIEWYTWDNATGEFELLPLTEGGLPLFGEFKIQLQSYGDDAPAGEKTIIVLDPDPAGVPGRYVSPQPFYTADGPTDQLRLSEFIVYYGIGNRDGFVFGLAR